MINDLFEIAAGIFMVFLSLALPQLTVLGTDFSQVSETVLYLGQMSLFLMGFAIMLKVMLEDE